MSPDKSKVQKDETFFYCCQLVSSCLLIFIQVSVIWCTKWDVPERNHLVVRHAFTLSVTEASTAKARLSSPVDINFTVYKKKKQNKKPEE